jgi:hypothetical protein
LVGTNGNEVLMYEVPTGRVLARWQGLRTGIESGGGIIHRIYREWFIQQFGLPRLADDWIRQNGFFQMIMIMLPEGNINYRIDEMRAALGLVQLRKLEANNERRRRLTQVYRDALEELVPRVAVPFAGHAGISAAHLMPVLLPHGATRLNFMENMKSVGIQTSVHYPPIHSFTAYQADGTEHFLPLTDDIAAREVTLPLYPALSDDNVVTVVRAVAQALNRS